MTVALPVATAAAVVTTRVLVVPVVMLGFMVAVTPAGTPVTASVTLPANPPLRTMAMFASPVPPCRTGTGACAAVNVNVPPAAGVGSVAPSPQA